MYKKCPSLRRTDHQRGIGKGIRVNCDVIQVDLMHGAEILPVDRHLLEVVERVEAVDDSENKRGNQG